MNNTMSSSDLKNTIIEFLKEHKSAALATTLDNTPRCSPVQYFMGNEMDIYILSAGGDKFKAIEQNSKVCLLVNTEYINYRQIKGVQIFGTADTSINNQNLFEEAKKYCPDKYLIENEREAINIIKITPEEVVYLNSLETGNRTKQLLKNNEVITKEDMVLVTH